MALLPLLQPVFAGLLLWTFHHAYVAHVHYVSAGPFDSGRPIDGDGWLLLAALAATALINLAAYMMIATRDPMFEDGLPPQEIRDQLGVAIYLLTFVYATVFTLTLVFSIGWLYVQLMMAIYVLIALPVIIASLAAR